MYRLLLFCFFCFVAFTHAQQSQPDVSPPSHVTVALRPRASLNGARSAHLEATNTHQFQAYPNGRACLWNVLPYTLPDSPECSTSNITILYNPSLNLHMLSTTTQRISIFVNNIPSHNCAISFEVGIECAPDGRAMNRTSRVSAYAPVTDEIFVTPLSS